METEYKPDSVSHPGETLLETMEALGMNNFQLAEKSGIDANIIESITWGETSITQVEAEKLEKALGVPSSFWLKRQSDYDKVSEPQTQAELCQREIIKIREITLHDDEYTGDLLAYAVGSPVGITMCVEARMRQIKDLQDTLKRVFELANISDDTEPIRRLLAPKVFDTKANNDQQPH